MSGGHRHYDVPVLIGDFDPDFVEVIVDHNLDARLFCVSNGVVQRWTIQPDRLSRDRLIEVKMKEIHCH